MIANDDVRFETKGWDDILRAHFKPYPDGILLACPYDPVAPAIATFPIMGWGWLKTVQSVYSGYFFYWYEDKWEDPDRPHDRSLHQHPDSCCRPSAAKAAPSGCAACHFGRDSSN